MAGPCACHSPCLNSFHTGKDKLADAALTKRSRTLTPTLAVSCALTTTPVTAPTIALSLDNKLFKQFIKVYLEAHVPVQSTAEVDLKPYEQPLKAQFLDLY